MTIRRVIDYLKTIAMVKRNFTNEMKTYEGFQDPELDGRLAGRAQAYQDFINELETMESDIVQQEMANSPRKAKEPEPEPPTPKEWDDRFVDGVTRLQ